MPTMFGCAAKLQQRLVGEIDRGPVGDVVEHDRPRGVIGERGEMLHQAALRRPRVIGARDQIAVDRPGRRLVQRIQHLRACWRRTGRGRSADSVALSDSLARVTVTSRSSSSGAERHAFARGRGEDQSVDRAAGIVPDQPAQRRLVEFAVAKRRDERQPQALQAACEISQIVGSVMVPSPHGVEPETGPIKNPVQTAGLSGSALAVRLSRASISGPRVGTFFDDKAAHERVIMCR